MEKTKNPNTEKNIKLKKKIQNQRQKILKN